MSRNAVYSFVAGVQAICADCWLLGFRFDPAGVVVRVQERTA